MLAVLFSATWLWAGTDPFVAVTTQPQSQIVEEGESVIFTVIAMNCEDFTIPLSNSVNLDMIAVGPGTFMMGSPEDELGKAATIVIETQHQVTLTKGYWLGKYEVTQAQYKTVMKNNPSWGVGDNRPVEQVYWDDATNFCAKLTAIEKAAGRLPMGYEYTLPTEAQWEYACRAGTTTALNSGKNLTGIDKCSNMNEVGWYLYNCGRYTDYGYDTGGSGSHTYVGKKLPNAWGLYDMHGNVSELCLDWYGDYPDTAVTDPTGPSTGEKRVVRGGNWFDRAQSCRSASRSYVISNFQDKRKSYYLGFRVALAPVQSGSSSLFNNVESMSEDFSEVDQTEDEGILTYQWYKDGIVINGATNNSYKISSVKPNDMGNYTVKVSNQSFSATSDTAILTVIMQPEIITQPESLAIREGNTVTFDVVATGGDLKYQWKKDGLPISGATTSSYTISNVKLSDAGGYTVTVSNSAGSVTSDVAVLTIKTDPIPEVLSVQRSVNVIGNIAYVTLTIANAPKGYFASLEDVWYRKDITFSEMSEEGTISELNNGVKVNWSGFDLSGNYQFPETITYTASVLEGTSTTVNLNGKLMITTTEGVVEANVTGIMSVTFVIPPTAPVIVKDLESKTISERSRVTFSVTATGSEPLLYQWFKNNSLMSGVKGSSYTIPSVSQNDAGTYMVLVTNAQGAAMSAQVTLTVTPATPKLVLEQNGNEWKITFTGTLQESSDMESWKRVTDTQNGIYIFTPTEGKKFYRAVQ